MQHSINKLQWLIVCLFLIFYSVSFPQDSEVEELFHFDFGSSKEVVLQQWEKSKLSKYGVLSQKSDDTLSLRTDNFRIFNGWNFLFANDSLFKIIMYKTTPDDYCGQVLDFIQQKFGEPKVLSGFYNWYYPDIKDSSQNKINLACISIGDSSRVVLTIVNKKLEVRKWDLTYNIGFLEGVNGLKWKSLSNNVKQYMEELKATKFVSEDNNEYNHEKKLIYKNGSFLRFPVKEWQFKFYYNQLFNIELTFERSAFRTENDLQILVDSLINNYGEPFSKSRLSNGFRYLWYFNRPDMQWYIIGNIDLELYGFDTLVQVAKLEFEFSKFLITDENKQ